MKCFCETYTYKHIHTHGMNKSGSAQTIKEQKDRLRDGSDYNWDLNLPMK